MSDEHPTKPSSQLLIYALLSSIAGLGGGYTARMGGIDQTSIQRLESRLLVIETKLEQARAWQRELEMRMASCCYRRSNSE